MLDWKGKDMRGEGREVETGREGNTRKEVGSHIWWFCIWKTELIKFAGELKRESEEET